MMYAMSEIRGRAGRVQKTVTDDTLQYYERKLGHWQRIIGHATPIVEIDYDRVGNVIAQRRSEGAEQPTIFKELSAVRRALWFEKNRGLYPHDPDKVTRKGEFASGYVPVKRHLTWETIPRLIASILRGSAQALTWDVINRAKELYASGRTLTEVGSALGCSQPNAHRIVHMTAPAEPTPVAIEHAQIVAWLIATAGRLAEVWRARLEDHDLVAWTVFLRGTKTKRSAARVPIAPPYRPYLQFALNGRPERGPLFTPWTNINRGLELACKRVGIPRVSPNDLRRTHTTLLASHPERPIPNSALLPVSRHTTTRMLDEVYVHHDLESTMRMLERLEAPALPEGRE